MDVIDGVDGRLHVVSHGLLRVQHICKANQSQTLETRVPTEQVLHTDWVLPALDGQDDGRVLGLVLQRIRDRAQPNGRV